LTVLLMLLLGAVGYLWFTRPGVSVVRADDYAAALQAARSEVVDYTSFDYLTLDDDIEQIRRVAVGDLRDEGVKKLDEGRAAFTQAKFVVNTKIVGAGVTRVDGDEATALMKIQATQESSASKQAEVTSYQIEVTLKKSGDRWLLSGLKGTGTPGND
jgi:Mce-associated membrane protein